MSQKNPSIKMLFQVTPLVARQRPKNLQVYLKMKMTLPRIAWRGTGPWNRLSNDAATLSPNTKYCPTGNRLGKLLVAYFPAKSLITNPLSLLTAALGLCQSRIEVRRVLAYRLNLPPSRSPRRIRSRMKSRSRTGIRVIDSTKRILASEPRLNKRPSVGLTWPKFFVATAACTGSVRG